MVLAIVEGIPEEYENVKTIMARLNLNIRKLNYVFTMDVKLMMIVLGLMSASSSFPCPFCEISKDFEGTAPPRTLKSIR